MPHRGPPRAPARPAARRARHVATAHAAARERPRRARRRAGRPRRARPAARRAPARPRARRRSRARARRPRSAPARRHRRPSWRRRGGPRPSPRHTAIGGLQREVGDVPVHSGSGCLAVSLTRPARCASVRPCSPERRWRSRRRSRSHRSIRSKRPVRKTLVQQGVAVLGPRAQERLEPALRQHRDLGELGQRHADQPRHQVSGLVEAGGERLPVAVDALAQHDRRLLGGRPGAALLGPLPRGGALDAEAATRQRHLEAHPRCDAVGGLVAAQPLGGAAVTGDVAVQREADGVEDARLAGTGGAA